MKTQAIWEHLQMLAAATHFLCMTALSIIGPVFVFWIVLFTRYWFIAGIYLAWIWIFDVHTSEQGGRTSNWFRGLKFFEYVRDYFPITLTTVPDFKLDPKKNYVFGCFLHGVMPNGLIIALTSNACGIDNLVPNHNLHALTLYTNFRVPIFRDYFLSLGACSVSAKSINWLLSYPNGGKVAVIMVGGAAEALYTYPGVYKIVLNNRKGFIKLALKNGSPLVPVFSFGEVDVFKHLVKSENTVLARFQYWFKQKTGVPPLMFCGRGYYQRYVGLVPYKNPINVVIGKPIEVERNINPSQQEIDYVHQMFILQLTKLFEENKYKYIQDAQNTKLIIV